jgi:hypothetical protein
LICIAIGVTIHILSYKTKKAPSNTLKPFSQNEQNNSD